MATTSAAAPARRVVKKIRRRSWLKWVLWIGVPVLLVLSIVWWRGRASALEVTPVQVTAVQRGTVRDYVTSTAAGRVSAKVEASLRAEIMGKVRVVHKHRGDKVAAGEAIITYDADELNERLRLAQVAVTVAQAQTKQAEQNATLTETNLARAHRLQQSGSIATAEVENLEGQAAVLGRAIDAAHAGVSQAAANVELTRTALSKSVVRAPFAGTILTLTVEVGETTAPGAPIAEVADTSELHVEAEIDESDLGRISLGMPVDVSLDAFPGERVRGKLTDVAPSVSRDIRGGRSVLVDVALPSDARLRVGMSADVDIIVNTREATLFVPPNAVVGRGTDRSVYVVAGGLAHKRSIEVGVNTWEAVEVKSGLVEGDDVVSSLVSSKLTDGARVEVTRAAPK